MADLMTLLAEPNFIVLPELEPVLIKAQRFDALCRLYWQYGQESKLLSTWAKYVVWLVEVTLTHSPNSMAGSQMANGEMRPSRTPLATCSSFSEIGETGHSYNNGASGSRNGTLIAPSRSVACRVKLVSSQAKCTVLALDFPFFGEADDSGRQGASRTAPGGKSFSSPEISRTSRLAEAEPGMRTWS